MAYFSWNVPFRGLYKLQGMGGVIAATANIIAIWLSEGPMDSGFGYFLTAELVIISATVGYLSLPYSVSVPVINEWLLSCPRRY